MEVSFLPGSIGFVESYVYNDFQLMAVGTVTTLTGDVEVGDTGFGISQFGQL